MAGHSHWANIKHKKMANDAKKAAVITRMGKLIRGAIQVGGIDPAMNPRLRMTILKAKANGMVKDAIERILKKATEGEAVMESLTYEGYAAGGVAVVVEVMTDNRNRTPPEIRKLFERGGGAMGAPGCVAWQFKESSVFVIADATEDRVMEVLLEADCDARSIQALDDGKVEIIAGPDDYEKIRAACEAAKLAIERSDVTQLADNPAEIADLATAQKVQKLLDSLEEHDDVTAVHSNFAPTPEVAAQL